MSSAEDLIKDLAENPELADQLVGLIQGDIIRRTLAAHLDAASADIQQRWMNNGTPITVDDLGRSRDVTGAAYFDVINLIGGTGVMNSANPRQLDFTVSGSAGADCMFDYLVSACWTGTEGKTFASASGCTFQMYSTLALAIFAQEFDARFLTPNSEARATIFVCAGTYTADVTYAGQNIPNIFGAGGGRTFIKSLFLNGSDVANNSAALIKDLTLYGGASTILDIAVGNGGNVRFENVFFGTQGGTSTPVIRANNADEVGFHGCTFSSGTFTFQSSSDLDIVQCRTGIDLSITAFGTHAAIVNTVFSSCRLLLTAGGGELLEIVGCNFDENRTGGSAPASAISFAGISSRNVLISGCTIQGFYTTALIDISGWPTSSIDSGLAITGNVLRQTSTAATVPPYLTSSDADTANVVFANNSLLPNTAGNFPAFAVTGNFKSSVIGPNAPTASILYNVTGANNYFLPSPTGGGGGTGPAPDDGAYVMIGNSAALTAERALTAGNGVGFTDGGANSTATLQLVPLTALYDQSGAFNWVNRGGDLLIANSKALKLYSDNSATPATLKGTWDATTGHLYAGGSSTPDPLIVMQFAESFTNPSGVITGMGAAVTIAQSGGGSAQDAIAGDFAAAVASNFSHTGVLRAVRGIAQALSSADPADMRSFDAQATVAGGSVAVARYAYYVTDPTGTGSITTQYGLYIPALAKATNNYGLYSLTRDRHGSWVEYDGIAAPATPASDDIVVYNETGTDLLKAKEDNGAVYALTHLHTQTVLVDGTVTNQKTGMRMAQAGTITNVTSKTNDGVTIGATAWVGNIYKVPVANIDTDGGTTSIFTTAPTITNTHMAQNYGAPDLTTTFAAGDWLYFATTTVGTNATMIAMAITFRFT